MRRNYEEERASALEDEKLNPMQAMIGLVVLVAVVVIFCFAVWKITHANRSGALPGQGVENSQDSIANWGGQTIGSSETTPVWIRSSLRRRNRRTIRWAWNLKRWMSMSPPRK